MPRSARAFEAIHAIADKHAPTMRRAFTEAVAAARGGDLRKRLQAALDRGQFDEAYRVATRAWETIAEADLQLQIAEEALAALQQAGQVTQDEIAAVVKRLQLPEIRERVARGVEVVGRFDVTNPRAVEWARNHAASMIRDINEGQREAIRQLVERTTSGQMSSAQLAKEIQQTVGLHARQEAAVANFRAELEKLRDSVQPSRRSVRDRTIRNVRIRNKGLTQTKIDSKVDAYRAKLHRQRAQTIAADLSMTAAHTGQQIAWMEARAKGTLPPTMLKTPIPTGDDRTCPICVDAAKQAVPIDQPYQTLNGPRMNPPFHVKCRCGQGLTEPRGRRAAA